MLSTFTPLHCAAESGMVHIAEQVLSANRRSVDAKDDYAQTPLHVACINNREAIVRLLLEHGAALDARNDEGRTPLHMCASCGAVEVATLILQHHSRASRSEDAKGRKKRKKSMGEVDLALMGDCHGDTALHVAIQGGHLAMASLLLQYYRSCGLSILERNNRGLCVVREAAMRGMSQCLSLLLGHIQQKSSAPGLGGRDSVPILAFNEPAVPNKQFEVFEEEGHEVLHLPWTEHTMMEQAVMLAARHDSLECLELLLVASFSIPGCGVRRAVVLEAAALCAALDLRGCIDVILRHEAVLMQHNAPSTPRKSPRQRSSADKDTEKEKQDSLKPRDGDGEEGDKRQSGSQIYDGPSGTGITELLRCFCVKGQTLLHIAAMNAAISVVHCLLGRGASITKRNASQELAFDVAKHEMERLKEQVAEDSTETNLKTPVVSLSARSSAGKLAGSSKKTMSLEASPVTRRRSLSSGRAGILDLSAILKGPEQASKLVFHGLPVRNRLRDIKTVIEDFETVMELVESESDDQSDSTVGGTTSLSRYDSTESLPSVMAITTDTKHGALLSLVMDMEDRAVTPDRSESPPKTPKIEVSSPTAPAPVAHISHALLDMSPMDWDKILYGSLSISYKRDDLILVEGEMNSNLFLITKGFVRVEKRGRFVGRIGVQENVFGDIGYLLNQPPSASIIADSVVQKDTIRRTTVDSGKVKPHLQHARATLTDVGMRHSSFNTLTALMATDKTEPDTNTDHQTVVRVVSRQVVDYICAHDHTVACKFHKFLGLQLATRMRRLLENDSVSKSAGESKSSLNLAAVDSEDDEPAQEGESENPTQDEEERRMVKLRARFNLFDPSEKLMIMCKCSWSHNDGDRERDGKLSITTSHVCFVAKFFGFVTKVSFAKDDIADARKRGDSHIFVRLKSMRTHDFFAFSVDRGRVLQAMLSGGSTDDEQRARRKTLPQLEIPQQSEHTSGILRSEDFGILQKIAEHKMYESGEVIVKENRRHNNIFQLVRGSVSISKGGKVFECTTRAAFYGEVSFIDRKPASASVVAHTQVIGYMIPYQNLVEAMKEVAFASRMLRYIATLTASRVSRMTSWLLTETSSEVLREGYVYSHETEKWHYAILTPRVFQVFEDHKQRSSRMIRLRRIMAVEEVPLSSIPRSRRAAVHTVGSKKGEASYFCIHADSRVVFACETVRARAEWLLSISCAICEDVDLKQHRVLSEETEFQYLQEVYLPCGATATLKTNSGEQWEYKESGLIVPLYDDGQECSWDGKRFSVKGKTAFGVWNSYRLEWTNASGFQQVYFWDRKAKAFQEEGPDRCHFYPINEQKQKMCLSNGTYSIFVDGDAPNPVIMFLLLLVATEFFTETRTR